MSKHAESPETREMYLVMRTDRKVKRWLKTEPRTDGVGRCAVWVRYPAWAEGFMDQFKDGLSWVTDVYAKGIPTKIVKFVPEIPIT